MSRMRLQRGWWLLLSHSCLRTLKIAWSRADLKQKGGLLHPDPDPDPDPDPEKQRVSPN